MGILGERVGALPEVHAGKDMVDVVVGGLIGTDGQQQVPHLGALSQLPIVHRNFRRLLVSPAWVAALVDVPDGMPACNTEEIASTSALPTVLLCNLLW